MLFYKTTFHCDLADDNNEDITEKKFRKDKSLFQRRGEVSFIRQYNEKLHDTAAPWTTFCFITEYEKGRDDTVVLFSVKDKEDVPQLLDALQEALLQPAKTEMKVQEITILDVIRQHRTAERKRYLSNITDPVWNMIEERFNRSSCAFLSGINGLEFIPAVKSYNQEEILQKAGKYFSDNAFEEEIRRIYSERNPKKFYGMPVHYDFCFSNSKAGKELITLLFQALYSNKRLMGKRITYVSPLTLDLYYEENWTVLDSICQLARGTMLVFDFTQEGETQRKRWRQLHADTAGRGLDNSNVQKLFRLMDQYQRETLFVLLEKPRQQIFTKILDAADARLPILQFTEQVRSRENALRYLSHLIEKCNLKEFVPADWQAILTLQDHYTAEDVQDDFNFWYNRALQENVYTAYRDCCRGKKDKQTKTDSYTKLQNMVGLKEIKRIIDTILSDFRLRTLRLDAGLKCENKSLHMLFTGNPGSAKTTCARLLAGILKEQGFLQTGVFVECGRSDLVGKYVGWTAKIVKEKFSQARGGVLFIDEAYALNSNDHFGPEAINTVVQEMENHRDDVVVVFAGYPEPMEKFLQANEGLRSRIAFHLDFPDYNTDEMTEIFKLMLEKQGYTCEPEALEKARSLFSAATAHKEFGNGRFARNLLEQSIMKQSARLTGFSNSDTASAVMPCSLHRQDLITLRAEDIAVETVQNHRQEKPQIGF